MEAFVAVAAQPQGTAEGVDDGDRGVGLAAAFEADVIVHAHTGQRGQFLAAQSGGAAQSRAAGEADVLRAYLGPAGFQISAEFGTPYVCRCSHSINCGRCTGVLGGRVRAWNTAPRVRRGLPNAAVRAQS